MQRLDLVASRCLFANFLIQPSVVMRPTYLIASPNRVNAPSS